ncbi:hypothetical protein ACFQRL_02885 [Microbacterium fluvii]|uniref:ATP synthase protein I n=1 Tax=Microbacterium fluvii TaxID=415215 RepID=A0ABW2HDC0_9MICO|nr:hypothetical protein [Microbacterium fluvii]MCU4671538.1 hypothetical protein [Microbacterium fluvii]
MTSNPVTSTPILRTTLAWSGIVTAVLAVLAGVVGYLAGGTNGLWSGLVGVLVAAVFLAITGISILIANRWYGDDLYVPIFFGVVLGGWLLKFVVFIVALLLLRGQPWIDTTVFFLAVVVSVLASLAVDVVVLLKMRVPQIDVELPSADPDDDGGITPSGDSGTPRV